MRILIMGALYMEYYSGRHHDPLTATEIIENIGMTISPEKIEPDLQYLISSKYVLIIPFQGIQKPAEVNEETLNLRISRTNLYIITSKGIDYCESLQKSDLTKMKRSKNSKMKKIATILLKELRE